MDRDLRIPGSQCFPAMQVSFPAWKIHERTEGRQERETDGHRRVAELEQRLQEERCRYGAGCRRSS